MNVDDLPTDDRPQGPFTHFGKNSNGHNSATRQPIPFVFGSRVGFSGADPTAPFPVGSNSRWRPAAILENFKRPFLSNALSDSLHVCTQTILCPRSRIYNDEDRKIRDFFHKGESLADLRYRERTKRQIFRNSRENNVRGVYTLDWSQPEVFLVFSFNNSPLFHSRINSRKNCNKMCYHLSNLLLKQKI